LATPPPAAGVRTGLRTVSGDGRDIASGADPPNSVVVEIGDEECAVGCHVDTPRLLEHRLRRGPAVAGEASRAVSGHGVHDALGIDFADAIVGLVGDVRAAVRAHGAVWEPATELGRGCGTFIARESRPAKGGIVPLGTTREGVGAVAEVNSASYRIVDNLSGMFIGRGAARRRHPSRFASPVGVTRRRSAQRLAVSPDLHERSLMKSHATFARIGSYLSAAALLLPTACGSAPSTGDGEAPASPPATASGSTGSVAASIHGTLLYAKSLGSDHTVEFYEFGEGGTAIHESSSIDNEEAPFLAKGVAFSSLADAYAKLNTATAEVPGAILQADERAAMAQSAPAAPRLTTEAPGGASSTLSEEILSGAASTCSADELGDNWGASWFLNNFCITGNFRWCPTNYGWADSGQYQASWSQWTQFEGDFNLTGHIFGVEISCNWLFGCGIPTVIFDYDILPRRYETWTFTDGRNYYSVYGTSQCGHLDAAFLHD